MTNEKLKINFPIGGGDVFDIKNKEILFAYSGQFSNTTNNLDDLSIEHLEKFIPVGYKSILICERIKLIDLGNVVSELNFKGGKEFILLTNNNYKLFVPNWKREIETTLIYKPDSNDLSIVSASWDDFDRCISYGLAYSKKNNCTILVSTILETINWH